MSFHSLVSSNLLFMPGNASGLVEAIRLLVCSGAVSSVPGTVGSVPGAVGAVLGAVGSVPGAVGAVLGAVVP